VLLSHGALWTRLQEYPDPAALSSGHSGETIRRGRQNGGPPFQTLHQELSAVVTLLTALTACLPEGSCRQGMAVVSVSSLQDSCATRACTICSTSVAVHQSDHPSTCSRTFAGSRLQVFMVIFTRCCPRATGPPQVRLLTASLDVATVHSSLRTLPWCCGANE